MSNGSPRPRSRVTSSAVRLIGWFCAEPGPRLAVQLDVRREDVAAFEHLVADLLTEPVGAGVLRHGAHSGVPGVPGRCPAAPARLATMCGIVGYVGPNVDGQALDVVMEGLARLEYRGYDSAGVALVDGDHVATQKRAGKLGNLREALVTHPLPAVEYRHRAYPLGHPRRTDRQQRAPAPWGLRRQAGPDPQRDHRELPRPQGQARRRRRAVHVRDRHRGRRPPGGQGVRRDPRPHRGDAPGRPGPRRRLHAARDPRGHPGRRGRGAAQQPAGRRARRRRELPRLRRRGVHRPHPRRPGARPGPDRDDHPRLGEP